MEINVDSGRQKLCLIVDAQNLYYSARELYGKGSRIDFLQLREQIVGDRELGGVYSIAVTPEMREEPKALTNALKRLGYDVLVRLDHFEEQVHQLYKVTQHYDILAVASGDGVFLPLFQRMKEANKITEAYAFVDAMSADIPKTVSKLTYLDVRVLMGEFKTLGSMLEGE